MELLKKVKDLPQGVKASMGFFLASVAAKGISYIMTPVYTRLLTTEEYGQVSVFLTWLQIFGILAMFCLSYGVFNVGMSDHPDRRDEYSFSMLILSNLITLGFSVLLLALYPSVKPFLKLELPLVLLMLAYFFSHPAYDFWLNKQRYELKYKWSVFWSVLIAVASPVTAVACILLSRGESRLYPRIFGAEAPQILIFLGFYVALAKKNRFRVNTRYWKTAFLFNLPLIPHYLSTYLLSSADRIMISHLVGDSATAYYTCAYSVSALAMIVWTAINSSLVPYTYEKCRTGDFKAIDSVVKPILAVFVGACAFLILLAPEIVRLMATREYYQAIYVIPPMIGGAFFQVLYDVFTNILYFYKKPAYVLAGSAVAVAANIGLNFLFIPRYGYLAAGYTTLFCYAVQALIDYFALRKVCREKVYSVGTILAMAGAVVAIALFGGVLYEHTPLRLLVLAGLALAAALNGRRVLRLWAKMK